MSVHELVWTHDRDTVKVEAICHAEPGADCRVTCSEGCEEWCIERDERGPFHVACADGDGELSGGEETRHDMEPTNGYCNVCEFLNAEPSMIPESSDHGEPFEIGSTPFEPVWEGDYYSWKRVDS